MPSVALQSTPLSSKTPPRTGHDGQLRSAIMPLAAASDAFVCASPAHSALNLYRLPLAHDTDSDKAGPASRADDIDADADVVQLALLSMQLPAELPTFNAQLAECSPPPLLPTQQETLLMPFASNVAKPASAQAASASPAAHTDTSLPMRSAHAAGASTPSMQPSQIAGACSDRSDVPSSSDEPSAMELTLRAALHSSDAGTPAQAVHVSEQAANMTATYHAHVGSLAAAQVRLKSVTAVCAAVCLPESAASCSAPDRATHESNANSTPALLLWAVPSLPAPPCSEVAEAAHEHAPCCVLLDDGAEPSTSASANVAMTETANGAHAPQMLCAGATAYQKPCSD